MATFAGCPAAFRPDVSEKKEMTPTTKALLQSLVSSDPSLSVDERYGLEILINEGGLDRLRVGAERQQVSLLMTQKEAAQALGISRVTLWRLTKDSVITPVELTRGIFRYRRDEIESIARDGRNATISRRRGRCRSKSLSR